VAAPERGTTGEYLMSNPLVGKYFIGVHDEAMRSGIVEAAISDRHYLVRFDNLVGFTDGSCFPEALAVVTIEDMVGPRPDGRNVVPPPWDFFDDLEKRQAYDAWIREPEADRKPRAVPMRPGPAGASPSSMPPASSPSTPSGVCRWRRSNSGLHLAPECAGRVDPAGRAVGELIKPKRRGRP
jgi:hypothetical protein